MIIEDSFPQQSPEWLIAKAGTPSASRFSEIIKMNGEVSKSAKAYMYKLAGERYLGRQEEGYSSADMKRGVKYEPDARWLYSQKMGVEVQEVAFVWKNASKNILCSPDGLMPGKGLEIKCPNLANHTMTMIDRKLPADKHRQVHGGIWICGFQEWDFMSYYEGMPSVIINVKRDVALMKCFDVEMSNFIRELKTVYAKLKDKIDG